MTTNPSPFLEVTYRRGKPLAAYLYLRPRAEGQSKKSIDVGNGMILDLAADGRPIGVEISAPSHFDLELLNEVLAAYGVPPVGEGEIRPIPG